jgi:hypothetical protein
VLAAGGRVTRFAIEWSHEGPVIHARFLGTADRSTGLQVETAVSELRGAIRESRPHEVVVDVQALEFISAPSLRLLIRWITEPERCGVRFVCNADAPWQRRTFEALRNLAPTIVQVEEAQAGVL